MVSLVNCSSLYIQIPVEDSPSWIATAYSIAAGLPLLALSFLMLAPLFIWFAPDMTRKELTDFVGEKVA